MTKFIVFLSLLCLFFTVSVFTEDLPKEDAEAFLNYLQYRDKGDHEALVILDDLLAKHPDNVLLRKEHLNILIVKRDFNNALSEINYLLKLNKNDIDLLMQKAEITEMIEKKFPFKLYEQIVKIQPNHSEALFRLAEYYFFDKKYKKALKYYEKLYELSGHYDQIEHKLLLCLYKIGNYAGIYDLHIKKMKSAEDVEPLWDTFFEIVYTEKNKDSLTTLLVYIADTNDKQIKAKLYYMLVLMEAKDGNLNTLTQKFKKLKNIHPAEWRFYLATYYLENALANDDELALPLLTEALTFEPQNTDIEKYMIQYYVKKQDIPSVIKWVAIYRDTAKDNSLDITIAFLLFSQDFALGQQFASSLDWNAYDEKLLIELVYTLFSGKKYQETAYIADLLEKGRFKDKAPYDYNFALLENASALRDEPGMTRYFNRCMLEKYEDPQLMNYYGFSLLLTGKKLPEALDFLQRAYAKDPYDGAITDSLGWAYYCIGNIRKAEYFIDKSLSIIPTDPEVLYHKAKILYERKNYKEAARYIELAKENDKEKKLDYVEFDQEFPNCAVYLR